MWKLIGEENFSWVTLMSWETPTTMKPFKSMTSPSQTREAITQAGTSKPNSLLRPRVCPPNNSPNSGRGARLRGPRGPIPATLKSPTTGPGIFGAKALKMCPGVGIFWVVRELLALLGWDQDEIRMGSSSYVTFLSFPSKSFHGTVIGLPLDAVAHVVDVKPLLTGLAVTTQQRGCKEFIMSFLTGRDRTACRYGMIN